MENVVIVASWRASQTVVAAKVAEGTGRFPVQNVYFFTDMQKSTWLNVPPEETRTEGKPFFLFTAYNAPHFPLQAPPEDIAKYRDKISGRLGCDARATLGAVKAVECSWCIAFGD